jgi:hypothetical protein
MVHPARQPRFVIFLGLTPSILHNSVGGDAWSYEFGYSGFANLMAIS